MTRRWQKRIPLGSLVRNRPRIERLEPRQLLTVQITEFMASNQDSGYLDEDGDTSDWIEIHNSGPEVVDLGGWYLTDDASHLTKWKFPAHSLGADEYFVVFASGKSRAPEDSRLHTNFKLSRNGEYLALVKPDGMNIATQYGSVDADYPEQLSDISFGVTESINGPGIYYMPEPTPGAPNQPGVLGKIEDTRFSIDRGFYSASDLLPGGALSAGIEITADIDENVDTQIYFTTDGSLPSPGNPNATLYSDPIRVESTTILRAIAVADGYLPTNVDTHTYLFIEDVLLQDGAGLPKLTQTDYEMDPDIVNDPRFASLADDLLTLPTVSFVGAAEDLFGPEGIIENPTRLGREWERPVSVELLNQDGDGFQEDAGLRIQGAGSRARAFSKKGFQLFFRSEYGAGELDFPFFGTDRSDQIDRIAFRGNFFDSWTFNNPGRIGAACCGYNQALLLRDQFGHETHQAMGALAIAGNWVHLYLNGQYWGLYNAVERPDEQFAAHYLGGNAEDYDVLKQRPRGSGDGSPPEVVHGDRQAWNELMSLVREDVTSAEVYQKIIDVLDVEQFADYVLLNIFGGNFDWPHNNWYAFRQRKEGEKWTFISWDTENFIFDVNANRTSFSTNNSPGIIYARLRRSADFQLLFADRVHHHLFNQGALTPKKNIERFRAIVAKIEAGMNPESARWGDSHTSSPRNTIDTWQPVVDHKINSYFPQRTEIVLNQLLARDLYTTQEAPEIFVDGVLQHGGELDTEAKIKLLQPSSAFIDTLLIDEGADATAYIPGPEEFATTEWTELSFDPTTDPLWSAGEIKGTTGIGFDESGTYLPNIETNVAAAQGNSGSVLLRIEFDNSNNIAFERLQLQALYDDAFVAYLNGVEVARTSNIRTQLPPQAARARNHRADEFEVFDISSFGSLVRPGKNVLAIQAINVTSGSNDLLMVPKLAAGVLDLSVTNNSIWYTLDGNDPRDRETNMPSSSASQFTGEFSLPEGGVVKTRAFVEGTWSALSHATFNQGAPGDLNQDGVVDASDIDRLAAAIRENDAKFDQTDDGVIELADLAHFVQSTFGTSFGDSNLDGNFDSSDLVRVFQIGEYEDGVPENSGWSDGDWNGNGDFDTADLVLAFQTDSFLAAIKPI